MKCGYVLFLGLLLICHAICSSSTQTLQPAETSTPTTPTTTTTEATSSPTPEPTTAAEVTTSTPSPPTTTTTQSPSPTTTTATTQSPSPPTTTTTQSPSPTTTTATTQSPSPPTTTTTQSPSPKTETPATTTTSPSTPKDTSTMSPSQTTSKPTPETTTAGPSTAQPTTLPGEQTTSSPDDQQTPTAVPLANNNNTASTETAPITNTSAPTNSFTAEPITTTESIPEPLFWSGYQTAQRRSLAEDFPRVYKPPFFFSYFDTLAHEIHIHPNGYISFGRSQEYKTAPVSSEWPDSPNLLGVYWADFDTSENNQTGLYIVEDTSFLENATVESSLIRYARRTIRTKDRHFVQPLYALAVTWENVMPNRIRHPKQQDNATFQLIFATDSGNTYVIRNYQKLWRPTDNEGVPYDVSSAYSGESRHKNDSDILHNYSPQRIDKISQKDSLLLDNPESCVIGTQNFTSILSSFQTLPACPCSKAQAENDELFQSHKSSWSGDCYRSITANEEHLVQNCCYDEHGLLITDVHNARIPLKNNNETNLRDLWKSCCLIPSFICLWFLEQIKISNCSNYVFPYAAAGFGDPHIITFDNAKYTFNSQGDFVLFKSGKGDVELQGRTQITDNSNTTFFQAYALKLGQTNYQFSLESDKLLFNGSEQESGVATVSNNVYTITVRKNSGYLSHVINLKELDHNSLGLLGSLDGNVTNDLKFRNTMLVDANDKDGEIFNELANDWRVRTDESLFDRNASNILSNFIPLAVGADILIKFTNDSDKKYVQDICESELFCMQDYFIHQNKEDAVKIRDLAKSIEFQKLDLMKDFHFKNLPQEIFLNVTSVYSLQLEVESSSNVTYSVGGRKSFIENITFVSDNGILTLNVSENLERWRESNFPAQLMIYATNEANVSTVYAPNIHLCLCDQPDQCENEVDGYLTSIGNVISLSCDCGGKALGVFCERKVDPCSHCSSHSTCNASLELDYCGPCDAGFTGDGRKCFDVDECVVNNGGCVQACENTPGSFNCSCSAGFRSSGPNCTDIDECAEGTHDCEQVCINKNGNFSCGCRPGYSLSSEKACEDINECAENQNYCDDTLKMCHNIDGSFECPCIPGLVGTTTCFRALHIFLGSFDLAVDEGQPLDAQLLVSDSEKFKTLSRKISQSVVDVLQNELVGTENDLYVQTLSFELFNQTDNNLTSYITAHFAVHTSNASLTVAIINAALDDASNSSCKTQHCPFGSLYLILSTPVKLDSQGNLCSYPAIHKCDPLSSSCLEDTEQKSITCECLDGFTKSDYSTFSCVDINECNVNETHYCPGEDVCQNTVGSYVCECAEGKVWSKTAEACVANKCNPNQCKNDGVCYVTSDNSGFLCSCTYGWNGPDCGNEDTDARHMKIAVICVSAILGFCCFALFIIVTVLYLKQRKNAKKNKYNQINDDKPATQARAAHRLSNEMSENHQRSNVYSQLTDEDNEKRTSFTHRSATPTPESKKSGNSSVYYNKVYEDDNGFRVKL